MRRVFRGISDTIPRYAFSCSSVLNINQKVEKVKAQTISELSLVNDANTVLSAKNPMMPFVYNFAFAKIDFISARCFEKSMLPRFFIASSAFFLKAKASFPFSIGIPLIAIAMILCF